MTGFCTISILLQRAILVALNQTKINTCECEPHLLPCRAVALDISEFLSTISTLLQHPVFCFFLAALSLVWNKFQNDNNNNKKEQTCLPFCAGPLRILVHKLRFACRGSFYAFHSSLSLSSPIKPEMSARTTINFQNNTSHA